MKLSELAEKRFFVRIFAGEEDSIEKIVKDPDRRCCKGPTMNNSVLCTMTKNKRVFYLNSDTEIVEVE